MPKSHPHESVSAPWDMKMGHDQSHDFGISIVLDGAVIIGTSSHHSNSFVTVICHLPNDNWSLGSLGGPFFAILKKSRSKNKRAANRDSKHHKYYHRSSSDDSSDEGGTDLKVKRKKRICEKVTEYDGEQYYKNKIEELMNEIQKEEKKQSRKNSGVVFIIFRDVLDAA